MRWNRGRKVGYGLLIAALVTVAAPAFSATSPGSITITSPVASSAQGGTVTVDWTWRRGTDVTSTSTVDVYLTNNGLTWVKIASKVPVRDGGILWDASTLPDAPYALRAKVTGKSVRSTVSPIYVDNTKPTIDITRPSEGQIVIDDSTPALAVVAGVATLVSDARDAFTGVASVQWFLDEEQIGEGATIQHDFSMSPGQHVLKAIATDKAGNKAEDTINVLALPGTGALGAIPSPDVPPTELPVPDPGATPDVPPVPVPSETPSLPEPGPAPSEPPSDPGAPNPGDLVPTALPTP